jgi:hypothetical protein
MKTLITNANLHTRSPSARLKVLHCRLRNAKSVAKRRQDEASTDRTGEPRNGRRATGALRHSEASKVGLSGMRLLCVQEREIPKGAEDDTVLVLVELARLTWIAPDKTKRIRTAHINPNATGELPAE